VHRLFARPLFSHLLIDGVHLKVSAHAGDANVNVTLGVYAAFTPTLQAAVAGKVDAWLG
jgi:hypothetical protein